MTNRSTAPKAALLLTLLALCLALTGCTQNKSSAYQKAVDLFASGEYDGAAQAFDRLGDYEQAPVYAAYSHGLVLFEQGSFAQAEPYFEKAQDFMYGKSRYGYCHAYVLEQEGRYQEAAEWYFSLGDFENAKQAGNYCLSRMAEQTNDYATALYAYELAGDYGDAAARLEDLQFLVYEQANKLKAKGTWLMNKTSAIEEAAQAQMTQAPDEAPAETPDPRSTLGEEFMAQAETMTDAEKTRTAIQLFEESLQYYTLLGSYYNSVADASAVKESLREQQYHNAETLLAEGNTQEAYEAFLGLSGYSDAETRAEELAAKLGIPLAEE